jgi:hypothetical protein
MDDLSDQLHSAGVEHCFYADDLTIIASGSAPEIERTLQHGLHIIEAWCKKNFMEVNASKTTYLFLGSRKNNPLNLHYKEIPLVMEKHPKLLGVVLNSSRGFSAHAAKLVSGSTLPLMQIATVSSSIWGSTPETIRCFYLAQVESSLLNACPAWWGQTCDTDLKRLESIQARGAKLSAGLPASTKNADATLEANLLSLRMRAKLQAYTNTT